MLYGSGLDLLRQTPQFIAATIDKRLGKSFDHAYRHVEPLYGGDNPYMNAIRQNVDYLRGLTRGSRWPMLRRNPPVFTVEPNPMDGVRTLLIEHLKEVWGADEPARPEPRVTRPHPRRRIHVQHVPFPDRRQPREDLRLAVDALAAIAVASNSVVIAASAPRATGA